MKVLQVISSFPPAYSYGGPAVVAYEIAKKLATRGHSITVVTTDALDSKSRYPIPQNPSHMEGPMVFRFKNISNTLSWMNLPLAPELPLFLRKHLEDFDVVHLHEYRSFHSIVTHYYAKRYGVPYVLQPHGSALKIFEKQGLKALFDQVRGNKILHEADAIVAVSKSESEQIIRLGLDASRVKILPNGINLDDFDKLPRKGLLRERLQIDSRIRIVLYAGRIHPRKGIEFLIRSFHELLDETGNVMLVVAGPDSRHKGELEHLTRRLGIDQQVIFTGFLSDLREAYVEADLLVYPSIYEIFGLVPFEAIMCNTPVIVSDDCGCGEIVREAKCGLLVEYGDVNGLVIGMKNILSHPEMAQEMVERGKSYIRSNLNWRRIVARFEELYEDCVR